MTLMGRLTGRALEAVVLAVPIALGVGSYYLIGNGRAPLGVIVAIGGAALAYWLLKVSLQGAASPAEMAIRRAIRDGTEEFIPFTDAFRPRHLYALRALTVVRLIRTAGTLGWLRDAARWLDARAVENVRQGIERHRASSMP